ncbi:hypothetical protein Tco_1225254, partial [Tanacetum coccineum]
SDMPYLLDGYAILNVRSVASLVEIGEICSSKEDTKGGASLSSTMIKDDEGMSELW